MLYCLSAVHLLKDTLLDLRSLVNITGKVLTVMKLEMKYDVMK